jgi:hypothetical protein
MSNGNLYVALIALSLLCEGGHFSLFPAIGVKVFGNKNGGQLVSFISYSASIAALSGTTLLSFGLTVEYVYKLGLAFTCISLCVLFTFKE